MPFISQKNLIKSRYYGQDKTENLIINGDNHEALGLLISKYRSKVRCIYIDPPYNNRDNYQYNDDRTHEDWLEEITSVLKRLKNFLTEDGSIWISIDDNEMPYLKVAADKIFGRHNYVSTIIWQQRTSRENRSTFSNNHEYILVYTKNQELFKTTRNLLPLTQVVLDRYKNPDNDFRGPWQSISANVQGGHGTKNQFYILKAPDGSNHTPPNGRCWVYNKSRMMEEINNNNIWFGSDGNGVPRIKKFLNGAKMGLTPETIWLAHEAGTNNEAKKHFLEIFPKQDVFDTPKPEKLIQRILQIATNEGDLVLDCYLGSGSTASTALKMSRRFIGIELDKKIVRYAVKRLSKVIEGEQGGISKEVKWNGSKGGFTYIQLLPHFMHDGPLVLDRKIFKQTSGSG